MAESGELIHVNLRPPLEVALAKAVKGIPRISSLPGQMLFESKVDGTAAIGKFNVCSCRLACRWKPLTATK